MKVTLTHDGKSVELDLTVEQMTALGLKEEKKRTGYEMVGVDRDFWFVDGASRVCENPGGLSIFTKDRYRTANYYSDYKLAAANARADSLMRQLRRFAAENGGIPSKKDWECIGKSKWYIEFMHIHHDLGVAYKTNSQTSGVVYFNNSFSAHNAIEKFRDELIWYFTEYEAMLR